MTLRMDARKAWYLLTAVLTVTCAASARAGGFYITVERPSSSAAAEKDAVLIVKAGGCIQPQEATVTATAEGLVNGGRRSLALKLTAIVPGAYAIRRQWPAEGVWMIAITGTALGVTRSALIDPDPKAGTGGQTAIGVASSTRAPKILDRRLTSREVDEALRARAADKAGRIQASKPVR